MEKYYIIEAKIPVDIEDEVDQDAREKYHSTGVEEYNIEEAKVDEILGERSYSGGDVPESVIDDVTQVLSFEGTPKKYYFSNNGHSKAFQNYLLSSFNVQANFLEFEVKDWNEEWRKSYQKIDIDGLFQIIPEWEKEDQVNSDRSLLIYPGQGFGTGSHETTFLCMKQFFKYGESQKITECLDFGCGSGILGLAARKVIKDLAVDLYDIDQAALDNTKQNIELNELDESGLNLYLPEHRESIDKQYELVFANILQNVLLAEKDYLANSVKEGGLLILSGLLKGQEKEVIDAYKEVNPCLELLEISQKNDWVSVIMESE